ncbi:MAG: hypothetical protein HFF10_13635 [Angelakisella sp.]|mgnify:FL=1|nr:hypothetical protein [Angelakisella sp.]
MTPGEKEVFLVEWYNALTKQEKKQFWTVIAVTVVGAVLILLVPAASRLVF